MRRSLFSVLLLAGCGAAQAAVVINELLGSTTGTDTEFVELYNAGAVPVDIGNWQVVLFDSDAGTAFGGLDGGSPFTVPAGVVLAPGQHFLFANATAAAAFGVSPDVTLPENAIENSSYTAILKDPAGVRRDAVFVRDAGAADAANDGGTIIAPDLTAGPDGTLLPAGFKRVPDGADSFALLEFSPVPAPSATPRALAGAGDAATCSDPTVAISAVQGHGDVSPLSGSTVAVRGVVTGDFQGAGGMRGFFIQSEPAAADGDPATSEGLFVFDPADSVSVSAGDVVRVAGRVSEFNGLTHVSSVSSILRCGAAPLPEPTMPAFPVADLALLERHEGMRVQPVTADGGFTLAQNFFLGRYGQVTLASPDDAGQAGRMYQPTALLEPSSPAAIDLAAANMRRRLILDDAFEVSALGDNPNPVPLLGLPPRVLRAGDRIEGLLGILDQGRIDSATPAAIGYRLQPTGTPLAVAGNPRTPTPDAQRALAGRLRIAAMNAHNYFRTIDEPGAACFGPDANPRANCRGADSAEELLRQRSKLVAALRAMNADLVALAELENSFGPAGAIADLVAAINADLGVGTYAWLDPGVAHIGTDAIAVGFIYKPAVLTPVGVPALLTSAVDPAFIDTLNRPALAQTFAELSTGERFTAVANHLKSKGSACDGVGDPNAGDGQGNCNGVRTAAAQALGRWLAADPTGSGDEDFLVLGDLNAYAQEDPLRALRAGGMRDQVRRFAGDLDAYSYVFDGQSGALDHALANVSLSGQVAGAIAWHINADEPAVIDFDQNFNPPGYYAADAYRSSDHDPLLLGLELGAPRTIEGTPRRDRLQGGPGYERLVGNAGGDLLLGAGGVDVFVYTSLRDAGDRIGDFEVGIDAVDLRPLLGQLGIVDALIDGHVSLAEVGDDAVLLIDRDGRDGPARPLEMVRLEGISAAHVDISELALLR